MNLRPHRVLFVFALGALISPTNAGADDEKHDIIVEGAREQTTLTGGEWAVSVTRSYRFGQSLDGNNSSVAIGKDRAWRFCLADTQVEDFVRLLVGQGRSQTAGTTLCRPLQVKMGEGKLRATQTCQGGSVTKSDEKSGQVTSKPTRLVMYVTGNYSGSELKLDFENRRELLVSEAPVSVLQRVRMDPPDIMRWSVSGQRVGPCAPGKGR